MDIDACYQLGYVLKPHGLKGEVQIFLDVDFPETYKKMESVFIEIDKKLVPFFISKISIDKSRAVVMFEDVDTFEKARELKGHALYLPEEKLPPLEEGQFYYHEVIGYRVIDKKEGVLGTVQDIYTLPGQELMAMQYKGKEVLVPLHDNVLLKMDRMAKEVHVNLPEGLLQVYLDA